MLPTKFFGIPAFAGTLAASFGAFAPSAWSEPQQPLDGQAQYLPIQSISYEFGSKFMSGYFVQQAATCFVSVMIIEKIDPEAVPPVSATRVRLVLQPGQTAGLDSEEGRSLNLTCGEDAAKLHVDSGDREKMMTLQSLSLAEDIAKSR